MSSSRNKLEKDDALWTKPKRPKSKKKASSSSFPLEGFITDLPAELAEMCLMHLDLDSLLRLCYISKAHARFMLGAGRDSFWTRKFSSMGLPIPDHIRPLARYANLVAGHSCTECGRSVCERFWAHPAYRFDGRRADVTATRFTFMMVFCSECLTSGSLVHQHGYTDTLAVSELYPDLDQRILMIAPSVKGHVHADRWISHYGRSYLAESFSQLQDKLDSLDDEDADQDASVRLQALKDEAQKVMSDAEELEKAVHEALRADWLRGPEEEGSELSDSEVKAKGARLHQQVDERLQGEGWTAEQLAVITPRESYRWIAYGSVHFKMADEPLTDEVWQRKRLAVVRYVSSATDFHYGGGFVRPPVKESDALHTATRLRHLLQIKLGDEDRFGWGYDSCKDVRYRMPLRIIRETFSDFIEDDSAELVENVLEPMEPWFASNRAMAAKLVRDAHAERIDEELTDEDVLDLPLALFTCRRCELPQVFSYEQLHRHGCLNYDTSEHLDIASTFEPAEHGELAYKVLKTCGFDLKPSIEELKEAAFVFAGSSAERSGRSSRSSTREQREIRSTRYTVNDIGPEAVSRVYGVRLLSRADEIGGGEDVFYACEHCDAPLMRDESTAFSHALDVHRQVPLPGTNDHIIPLSLRV